MYVVEDKVNCPNHPLVDMQIRINASISAHTICAFPLGSLFAWTAVSLVELFIP